MNVLGYCGVCSLLTVASNWVSLWVEFDDLFL